MKALRLLTAALIAALSLWAVPCTVLADAYYQLTPSTYTWDGTAGNRLLPETIRQYQFDYGDSGAVTFDLPWNFRFYGQNYTTITADTNGNIWLGTAIPSLLPNSFALASTGSPVISVWNNDLSSYYDGGVFIERKTTGTDRVVVHWRTETFADAGFGRSNEFEAVLFADGTIRFDYAAFNPYASGDSGSGISRGNGTNYLPLNGYGVITTLGQRSFTYAPDLTPPALMVVPPPPVFNIDSTTLSGTVEPGATVVVTRYGERKVWDWLRFRWRTVFGPIQTLIADTRTSGAWSCPVGALAVGGNFFTVAATDLSGNRTTIATTVTHFHVAPIANFSATPASGGMTYFTDLSQYATSWLWDFGDGTTSTVQNPTHLYLDDGGYTVTLTASNEYGSTQKIDLVNATCVNLPFRIQRTPPLSFATLAEAYAAATAGETIRIFDATLPGGITLNKGIVLDGGYDCSFTSKTGRTTLEGDVSIIGGSVIIKDVIIDKQ